MMIEIDGRKFLQEPNETPIKPGLACSPLVGQAKGLFTVHKGEIIPNDLKEFMLGEARSYRDILEGALNSWNSLEPEQRAISEMRNLTIRTLSTMIANDYDSRHSNESTKQLRANFLIIGFQGLVLEEMLAER